MNLTEAVSIRQTRTVYVETKTYGSIQNCVLIVSSNYAICAHNNLDTLVPPPAICFQGNGNENRQINKYRNSM